MKRKVIKQGASTLTTSLPASWVKEQKLCHGDEIEIDQVYDKLIIAKSKEKEIPTITFSQFNKTFIKNSIITFYCKGYDKLRIVFTDRQVENCIMETINNYLIGFDIVEKEKGVCLLENITEPEADQFEAIFKKLFFNLSLLISTTEQRLKTQQQDIAYKDIAIRFQQYENLCKRIIAKRNPLGENTLFFWGVLNYLVQAAKEIQLLNRFLDKNKVHNNTQLFSRLKMYHHLLEDAYLHKDPKKILALHLYHQKHVRALDFDKIFKLKEKDSVVQYHTLVAIRNLYLASNALLGMI
ncbi:MAG: hypothetical protein AABX82_03475 [Nanoarchaeota archaeon]